MVPIIVNTVLNEHQLVLDIVAFVDFGNFPRSRLGEKQRGKILASWVSRKMRTLAQFSIRDPDAEGSVGTVVPEQALLRRPSAQSGLAGANSLRKGESSLRHVESVTQMPVAEESPSWEQHDPLSIQTHDTKSPSGTMGGETMYTDPTRNDDTPTQSEHPQLTLNTTTDYSPVDQFHDDEYSHPRSQWDTYESGSGQYHPTHGYPDYPTSGAGQMDYSPEESPVEVPKPLGTLKVANRTSIDSDDDDWGGQALKELNLGPR